MAAILGILYPYHEKNSDVKTLIHYLEDECIRSTSELFTK